ncbi:MAG: (d)CMP kinase [Candidatus Heimdallarchaeaceae archaeon]
MPIIAISGQHGSGKTTAAKMLAESLNYRYLSAGSIFREMAEKKGYTLEEFTALAEKDTSIDEYIDRKTVEIAKSEKDLIVDAQLAGWLLKDIADLSICISASFDKRIERIAKRENRTIEEVFKETITREKSEKERYASLYSFDLSDLSIYDLIINTDRLEAQTVVKIILAAIKERD